MKKKGKGDRSEEKSVDARAQRYARRVYRTTGAYVEIRPCPNWWLVNPCHIRDLAHIGTAQIDSCRAIFAFFVPHSLRNVFAIYRRCLLQITGNRMPADLCRCLKKEEKDSMREF